MKMTKDRIARYLESQKKINDKLLKVSTKNREAMIAFSEVKHFLLQGELKMRELLNIVAKENVNG